MAKRNRYPDFFVGSTYHFVGPTQHQLWGEWTVSRIDKGRIYAHGHTQQFGNGGEVCMVDTDGQFTTSPEYDVRAVGPEPYEEFFL